MQVTGLSNDLNQLFEQAGRKEKEQDVVKASRLSLPTRIAVISHDAYPFGAQYIALNIARELAQVFGITVEIVLLGEGELEQEFSRYGTVHRLWGVDAQGSQAYHLAHGMAARGVRLAIANTTASGLYVNALKSAGVQVVSVVHELPGIIEGYGLIEHARALATRADVVVFPADEVMQAFKRFAELDATRALVRPQGLYKRNRFRGLADNVTARHRLREKLGVPEQARIVLGVGYADRRKGIDLFVDVGIKVMGQDPSIHFLWVGRFDSTVEAKILSTVQSAGLAPRFHFLGHDPDTDLYYAGADLYALTSREDPFPSVVLESLQVGVPVVGFEGTGGFVNLLRLGCGRLAPAFDTPAFAECVRELLAHPGTATELGECGSAIVRKEYSFRRYVFDLLAIGGVPVYKVSVVVPNYNYAHYLPDRIRSIAAQNYPAYEIIVLDDASSDDSVEVVRRLEVELGIDITMVRNETNSGSVFRQWARGVELSHGDFIWIAEADDLAAPEFLAMVVPPFVEPSVVMSYCQSKQMGADGRILAEDYFEYTADVSPDRWAKSYTVQGLDEIRQCLAVKNTIPNVSAAVFRRAALVDSLRETLDEMLKYRIAGDWVAYVSVLERGNIAFTPKALNMHRRHRSSVTIGSDNVRHLLEVLRVQEYVRDRFALDEETREKARLYAQALHEYFGIPLLHESDT